MPSACLPTATETEPALPWTGRNPISAGWFEMRPARVPRDARPLYDEDMDCIIGYHRSFASVASTYDLAGAVVALDACVDADGAGRAPLLVAGTLWQARVRGMTRSGAEGEGLAAPATTLARLHGRFIALARQPLHFTLAALADTNRGSCRCISCGWRCAAARGPLRQRTRHALSRRSPGGACRPRWN
ncbi:hypothetical protein CNE_1c23800 [Cupriavidus necator N-1]|uniref:Uncharacterized protein n=1 Tax=Cupriavidus necator (strain ATCC 43291 / DSM 13513 / CCUG 52238 / LMG 8453 / N-1) TaxID=1042878 RepID=G0F173_CUPNN|nr:hypothetical protein [Cupriavidus necator]AEI77704.1 hypothetical protein CNE_1c23800 [Cupriavidus necator N-1]MDX6013761.1 hypothetical protein [Cupriavidus necator]